MERIQFYPSRQLKELLCSEANMKGVSISNLVIQLLQDHYHITPEPEITLTEVIPKVLAEVEEYVRKLSYGDTFDLISASATFEKIEMTVEGRPATNRATIGKVFTSRIGIPPFSDVGVTVRKSENRATMYMKIKEKKE